MGQFSALYSCAIENEEWYTIVANHAINEPRSVNRVCMGFGNELEVLETGYIRLHYEDW